MGNVTISGASLLACPTEIGRPFSQEETAQFTEASTRMPTTISEAYHTHKGGLECSSSAGVSGGTMGFPLLERKSARARVGSLITSTFLLPTILQIYHR